MKRLISKNNKGFTLIELLAVIALIGVVFSIATLSISSVQKRVVEAQEKNVINRIEVGAQKYFDDT
ncbi:MAG: type II secretion system protein, partial [Bacilli bacterium]|nr:type II secretion system protein [Bacilli bacterium]MBQ6841272.1 type II secretion system protein [Bacilli bacterium]